jgi:hypothetical protein
MLLKMEPAMDAWTMSMSPLTRARIAMRSSMTLPKVALRRPPQASPSRAASSSVAKLSPPARGIIARSETTKTATELWPLKWRAHAIGQRMGAATMTGTVLIVFWGVSGDHIKVQCGGNSP